MVARNEALDATPELVNTDPYGDGWLFEIRAGDGAEAGGDDGLLDAAAYQAEPRRLRLSAFRLTASRRRP